MSRCTGRLQKAESGSQHATLWLGSGSLHVSCTPPSHKHTAHTDAGGNDHNSRCALGMFVTITEKSTFLADPCWPFSLP